VADADMKYHVSYNVISQPVFVLLKRQRQKRLGTIYECLSIVILLLNYANILNTPNWKKQFLYSFIVQVSDFSARSALYSKILTNRLIVLVETVEKYHIH